MQRMEFRFPLFEKIWLADDDHDDCELFADVLKQILPSVQLALFTNGNDLMTMLNRGLRPDLLFLDINMPLKDGLDCLLEIRSKRHFCRLPIIMFSCSQEKKFIDASYGYGAN